MVNLYSNKSISTKADIWVKSFLWYFSEAKVNDRHIFSMVKEKKTWFKCLLNYYWCHMKMVFALIDLQMKY